MSFSTNKKQFSILILGKGLTGISVANWCNRHNIKSLIYSDDEKNDINFLPSIIIRSPGFPKGHKIISHYIKKKITICGDFQAAKILGLLPENIKIIGITGTNGKTTVTKMVYSVMKSFNKNTYVVGNIGIPLFNIIDKVNKNNERTYLIAELSSFQLSDRINLPVDSGVILNITDDHLDWHKNYNDYVTAKINIFNEAKNKIANFDCKKLLKKYRNCDDVTYFGDYKKKENFYFQKRDNIIKIFENNLLIHSKKKDITKTNIDNVIASVCVLNNYLPITKSIINTLLNFITISHRFENFFNKNGIRFINDSKSTNIGATIAALNNLSDPIILIFGGQTKKQNISLINNHLKMVKVIVIIGDEKKKIKDAINGNMKILLAKSLHHAVRISSKYFKGKDVVLFSPGCASKDWFKNFEDRGSQFKKIVAEFYEKN